jgi:Rha family phage regulatory protein
MVALIDKQLRCIYNVPMTKQIILSKRGEALADSRVVAEKFGKRHTNVIRKIESLISDLNKIKGLKNETLKFTKKIAEYRGVEYDYYEMNREAFSLLVMSFTGKSALEWRIKFNKAFYEMERSLIQLAQNQQSEMWLAQREQAKLARKEETDVIKQFVDYATAQGSTKAKFYYKHITTVVYKCLGLIQYKQPKLRETLDMMQTSQLILAEMTAKKSLIKYMKQGEHYKAIFPLVKRDLEAFANYFFI